MINIKRRIILLNRDAPLPNLQIMVTLNFLLNVTQRIGLVNGIFNRSVTYGINYTLSSIQIAINPASTPSKKNK